MNLYVIEDMLYSFDEVEKMNALEDVEYAYNEPDLLDIGNELFMIVDNENFNFEILKEIKKGVYKSLTVERVQIIEDFLNR